MATRTRDGPLKYKETPATGRTKRLAVGVSVLLLIYSGAATATAPRVSAPVLVWQPVTAPDAPTPSPLVSTPDPPVIVDTARSTPRPTKPPIPKIEQPVRSVTERPTEKPAGPVSVASGRSLRGLASWFCRAGRSPCHYQYPDRAGFDAYAAAGPALRAAICGVQSCTSWRNRIVSVNGVRVRLVDWCQCYWKQPHEKIIDLYYDVFRRVGGNVVVSW